MIPVRVRTVSLVNSLYLSIIFLVQQIASSITQTICRWSGIKSEIKIYVYVYNPFSLVLTWRSRSSCLKPDLTAKHHSVTQGRAQPRREVISTTRADKEISAKVNRLTDANIKFYLFYTFTEGASVCEHIFDM